MEMEIRAAHWAHVAWKVLYFLLYEFDDIHVGTVYRIVHDDCYTDDYTALRAQRSVGEEKYDFFEQNCEHSATWCKTGLPSSDQLQSCCTSVGKVAFAIFLRAVMLAVLWLLQISNVVEDSSSVPADRVM